MVWFALLIYLFSLSAQAADLGEGPLSCIEWELGKLDAKALDHLQDFKMFGGLTYVTDGMGTLQRINPHKAFWGVTNEKFEPLTALSRQLTVDTSQAERSDLVRIKLDLEQAQDQVILKVGSKTKFQRSPDSINVRLNRNLDTTVTDGIVVHATSSEPLEMKVIIGASGKQNRETGSHQQFSSMKLFESPFQKLAVDKDAGAAHFYWKNFSQIEGKGAVEEGLNTDQMWVVLRRPDGKLKAADLAIHGPIYAEQDLFGEHADTDPERLWKGMGTPFKTGRPKYLSAPVSQSFRNKIRDNLYNQANQLAAIRAIKDKTIEGEMKRLGFEYHHFSEKFEPSKYFTFFGEIEEAKIPIEQGEFGKYHGPEAHAAQIYAMTRGMSESELKLFKDLYQEIGHNAVFGWKIWSVLFDGPNPSLPTSPRYWKILELEQK